MPVRLLRQGASASAKDGVEDDRAVLSSARSAPSDTSQEYLAGVALEHAHRQIRDHDHNFPPSAHVFFSPEPPRHLSQRVATCSSDRTIKIFDVSGETQTLVANLTGHDGPVWMCTWAHPKFGVMLASCSFDQKVIIWKESEQQPGAFSPIYTSPATLHDASVNAVAWAPHELGLALACASSDGSISVISRRQDGQWDATKIPGAHSIGCTGVCWSPAPPPGSLVAGGGAGQAQPVRRLVSSGCDNLAKIWRFDDAAGGWKEEHALRGHDDWVRDACWSSNVGMPMNTVATCGQDGKVLIWTQDEPGGAWNKTLLNDFGAPVWRLSWSVMGSVLAVSDANNLVTVWKESVDGKWDQIAAAEQ